MMNEEERALHQAHGRRAVDRAKATILPGDILQYTLCAGLRGRAKFTGWDGQWACSQSRNDIHPLCIFKVNGKLTSFRDDGLDPRSPKALA